MIEPAAITVQPARTMFGKRGKGYVARFGRDADVRGATKTEAKQNLLDYLAAIEEHHRTRRYVICGDGQTVLVIYWYGAGWAYDIIDRERTNSCGCMTRHTDLAQVVKDASSHAEQSYGGVVRVIS